MKKHMLILSLALGGMLIACDEQNAMENTEFQESTSLDNTYYAPSFAEPDKSEHLNGTPSENLKALFEATGPKIITSMGRMNITETQYQEIAEYTTNYIVAGKTSQAAKHKAIFEWLTKNITYGQSDPDPYPVFKNKKCVCQGYANLLTVMCHTQSIPAVVVNGYLNGYGVYGGHAWNYVCPDGLWMVSDPTNGGYWDMSNVNAYTHLSPSEADVDIFTDDYATYRYYNYSLNVNEVKNTGSNVLVVPYSVGGFVISSFIPSVDLPESLKEIYLGENITTLGESYNMSLSTSNYGKNLQAIYVDKNNPALLDHKGVVYRKNGDQAQLYYIPGGMEFIELIPMEVVEKNTIYNHYTVKVIYFPAGTKRIEDSAIENCPNLERVYIPDDAVMDSNALYNCPQNVEIVRGVPSGIKHVTI